MTLTFKPSLNYEVLSLLNTFTDKPYYADIHIREHKKFMPLLSLEAVENLRVFQEAIQPLNASLGYNYCFSTLKGFDQGDIFEAVDRKAELRRQLEKSPYTTFLKMDSFDLIYDAFVAGLQVVRELFSLGFREYWEAEYLPGLEKRCQELGNVTREYDFRASFQEYKRLPYENIDIYVSRFQHPHGTSLYYTNQLLLSSQYSDSLVLNVIIHELFHCPYDISKIEDVITYLSQQDWVIQAFENQFAPTRYDPMEYFIEENIVEALAVFLIFKLGVEKEPYQYFREHDQGSHVISPKLFTYLVNFPKLPEEPFELYLKKFTAHLSASKL